MNILLIVLLVIGAIVVILLIIALFSKKEYRLQKEITIDKPRQEVFNYIKFLKNQDDYSKWVMTDPNKKKELRGTDGTVGFVYAWDGNKQAGKGEQEIRKIMDGERIDTEVRFERPFKAVSDMYMTTEKANDPDSNRDQTKVTWVFGSKLKYPVNLMLVIMEKMLGKDMEISLTNLKNILEK